LKRRKVGAAVARATGNKKGPGNTGAFDTGKMPNDQRE
jgi:hypothetical protein